MLRKFTTGVERVMDAFDYQTTDQVLNSILGEPVDPKTLVGKVIKVGEKVAVVSKAVDEHFDKVQVALEKQLRIDQE